MANDKPHPLKQHGYTHKRGGSDPIEIPEGLGEDDLAPYLKKAGGVMTGTLTLSANPTADKHAATKEYVDDAAAQVGWEIVTV